MHPELEDYYNEFAQMFKTQGWTQLKEMLVVDAQNLNNLQNIPTERDLHLAQGQLKVIAWLLNFEDICEKTVDDLKNPEQEQ